jgi:DNA-binding transcriptional MerR regulator
VEGYSIGQVCSLLDIKPHVLRYWERELQFLNPEKDDGGRRRYSIDDLQLLFRIRYLVIERRMTLEGVSRAVWEESSQVSSGPLASVRALRRDLLFLSQLVDKQAEKLEKLGFPPESSDIEK